MTVWCAGIAPKRDPELGQYGGMSASPVEFRRKRQDAVIGGVCAGLATYFGSTPNIVRVVFVVTFFGLSGVSLPIYVTLWAIIPADTPRDPTKHRWLYWTVWFLGLGGSILAIAGVLSAEMPFELSMGSALIAIGGLLLSTPRPLPQATNPQYAPGQIITKERTGEIDPAANPFDN